MNILKSLAVPAAILCAQAASADQVISDDLLVLNNLCVGPSCDDGESFSPFTPMIKMKGTIGAIEYIDENSGTSVSETHWRLQFNETVLDQFMVKDTTDGTTPLTIEGGAPTNAFVVTDNGHIGMGTSLPTANLHVVAPSGAATLTLDAPTQDGSWQMSSGFTGFFLVDAENSKAPFILENNAPDDTIYADQNGNIGLGTNTPEGKLHTKGNGVQLAYFESGDGDAVQVRFRTDSENRRFLAVDNANNVKTQMQFKDDSIKFLGQTVADEWLSVSAAGITTAGPTCNPGPCDATFDPDAFTVPSIADHASYMWENQHLWAVGPTKPGAPINLTEKMGGVIHELEVAHIYIEELHDEQAAMSDVLAQQQAQIAELTALLDTVLKSR